MFLQTKTVLCCLSGADAISATISWGLPTNAQVGVALSVAFVTLLISCLIILHLRLDLDHGQGFNIRARTLIFDFLLYSNVTIWRNSLTMYLDEHDVAGFWCVAIGVTVCVTLLQTFTDHYYCCVPSQTLTYSLLHLESESRKQVSQFLIRGMNVLVGVLFFDVLVVSLEEIESKPVLVCIFWIFTVLTFTMASILNFYVQHFLRELRLRESGFAKAHARLAIGLQPDRIVHHRLWMNSFRDNGLKMLCDCSAIFAGFLLEESIDLSRLTHDDESVSFTYYVATFLFVFTATSSLCFCFARFLSFFVPSQHTFHDPLTLTGVTATKLNAALCILGITTLCVCLGLHNLETQRGYDENGELALSVVYGFRLMEFTDELNNEHSSFSYSDLYDLWDLKYLHRCGHSRSSADQVCDALEALRSGGFWLWLCCISSASFLGVSLIVAAVRLSIQLHDRILQWTLNIIFAIVIIIEVIGFWIWVAAFNKNYFVDQLATVLTDITDFKFSEVQMDGSRMGVSASLYIGSVALALFYCIIACFQGRRRRLSSLGMSLQEEQQRKIPTRLIVPPRMSDHDVINPVRDHTYSAVSVGYSDASLDRPISPLIEPL